MTYVPLPGDGRPHVVTLIPGDGIGPEVTDVVTKVVDVLGAPIIWERCAIFFTHQSALKWIRIHQCCTTQLMKLLQCTELPACIAQSSRGELHKAVSVHLATSMTGILSRPIVQHACAAR